MEPKQKTLDEFIAEHRITMTALQIPARNEAFRDKDWDASAFHWACTLVSDTPNDKKTTMVVYYSCGSAHIEKVPYAEIPLRERLGLMRTDWENMPAPGKPTTIHQAEYQKRVWRPKAPTARDVLDSLVSDASSIENSRDFEDWAGDCGYDTDSRKAEATYNECCRLARELRLFLGRRAYDELLNDVERL
jgi:hypothetical protein